MHFSYLMLTITMSTSILMCKYTKSLLPVEESPLMMMNLAYSIDQMLCYCM